MATEAPKAPVTSERKIRNDLEEKLPKPYLARAMEAVSVDQPNGTPGHKNKGMSVLQQHAAFFDQDRNGVIYPWNTYRGLRQLGLDIFTSILTTVLINFFMSYPTLPTEYTKRSMGVIQQPLTLKEVNLENIFSKYGRTQPDKLSYDEVWEMTEANRVGYDPIGWIAAKGEWLVLYRIAKDHDGFLSKEAARSCYDGSLFEYIAKMKNNKSGDKKKL
ncbi:Caleosin [Corchorus capsularis]|uniref:Caleosin n=1 Tax=Corchorus capsularis TaxID=210143 RepID=A0A1R3JSQ3_COCAP|nr:Caleosin [Corchorus capsularis]